MGVPAEGVQHEGALEAHQPQWRGHWLQPNLTVQAVHEGGEGLVGSEVHAVRKGCQKKLRGYVETVKGGM